MEDALFRKSAFLQEVYAEGMKHGVDLGIAGFQKGIQTSVERMLRRIVMLRRGRAPTPAEEEAIVLRATYATPEEMVDIGKLSDDALFSWLARK